MNRLSISIFVAVLLIVVSAVSYWLFAPEIVTKWSELMSHEINSAVLPMEAETTQSYDGSSEVNGNQKDVWRVEERQLSNSLVLDQVFFLDERVAFATSYDKWVTAVHTTSDGGRTWQKLGELQDLSVDDFAFISPDVGYAIAAKLRPSSFPHENGSVIMKTIDGGKAWTIVYTELNASFYKIGFNAQQTGVVVGRSFPEPYGADHLVLLSKDGGSSWQNIAEQLNKVEVSPMGQVADTSTDFLFSEGEGLIVLSSEGKIYNTLDQGTSWKLISKIFNEPPQTGISRFGRLDDGRFWLSGGAISIEGNWGVLAVTNGKYRWNRFRLGGYYFSDMCFFSTTSVIAIGAKVGKGNFGGDNESNRGVILTSEDGGKTWKTIYESSKSTHLISIKPLSESKYQILGNKGIVLTLSKVPRPQSF